MSTFYISGGTLPNDAPSYVERQADKELLAGLARGEFCYVLTSRQMGKSSLMGRTAKTLRDQGVHVVIVDLTAIGLNLTPEQWYDGLLMRVGRQLALEEELDDYWLENGRSSPVQRFFSALQDVALRKLPGPLVIFIDEIDTVRSLPFSTTEFFAAVRECYNRRSEDSELDRLTFCLLGVAIPSDLINDAHTTPFNIGQRIDLTDFTAEEAQPLALGLGRGSGAPSSETGETLDGVSYADATGRRILDRILHWTNGHPYLTQRLCRAIAERTVSDSDQPGENSAGCDLEADVQMVDALCQELLLSNRARERDDNLLFVRETILRGEADLISVLDLYYQIRCGQRIRDDESNPLIEQLRLSGITSVVDGCLRVRNRIYFQVFDGAWVAANLPAKSSEKKSIAVLPFENLSADAEHEYLSDGITEDLITALSQVKALWVAARTSSFTFKGQPKDIRKIGELLKVTLLLDGSVRKVQDHLRIHAQLIHVTDGYHVWSERFERRMEDVFAIQDEISRAIVEALKIRLATEGLAPLVKKQTDNTEAYQYYLRGRYFLNRRGTGIQKALLFFKLALLEDPDYALAHTGVADSYNLLGFYDYLPPKDAIPKAKEAAVQALQLDESSAEAHNSLGFARLIYDWDGPGAEKELKRALELNPNCGAAVYSYASFCAAVGRPEESIALGYRAVELDPLSSLAKAQLGWLLLVSRRYHEASDRLKEALDLQPNFMIARWILGQLCAAQGKYPEALTELEQAAELSGRSSWMLATLAYVRGLLGQAADALAIADELQARSKKSYVRTTLLSTVQIGLGHYENALSLLEKAFDERDVGLVWLKVDPVYDQLRGNARFTDLSARIGL